MRGAEQQSHDARLFGFYAVEFERSSPLYGHLARGAAADHEVLALFSQTPEPQRKPTLLMAVVHYLLLAGAEHPLRDHFPSLGGGADPAAAYPRFRDFVLRHADEVSTLLRTRGTQTNEVRRSGVLLPGFGIVGAQAEGAPLAVVEVGASAGLNLRWDRYGYSYGNGTRAGDPAAGVQVDVELVGSRTPPLPEPMPVVASRLGIDLAPLSPSDPADALWLRALVWPEQTDRAALLERAIADARDDAPEVVAGDAIEVLPAVAARIPRGAALVIFHTTVLPYVSDEDRRRLSDVVAAIGAQRDCWWLTAEGPRMLDVLSDLPPEVEQHFAAARAGAPLDGKPETFAVLGLVRYRDGIRSTRYLARAGMQGHWIEWLDAETAG